MKLAGLPGRGEKDSRRSSRKAQDDRTDEKRISMVIKNGSR
jgi:hypothetical protein